MDGGSAGGAPAWDARLAQAATIPPLLQSWGWGEVQKRSGWAVERVEVEGSVASVLTKGPGRAVAYVPRGPVPASRGSLEGLLEWARARRLAILRVEPEAGPELEPHLRQLGFTPSPEVQPGSTLIVTLAEEEALLTSFRPKGRYNVRLALRKGVEVEEGADADELARQAAATAARQGIHLPGAAYYRLLLDHLPVCRTYVARVGGEALAAILVAEHGGRAYYLFGGSDGRRRELMPNHALQFRAMAAAYRRGCRDYDLWGLPPAPEPSHPWFGLWQFKTGFGGRQVRYVGCWELALKPLTGTVVRAGDRLRAMARRIGH